MIGKIGSGGGFAGLARYLLQGDRDAPNPERVLWTSTRELAVDDPTQAAVIMRATAAQGRTAKPVQHLSLSLAPGEHLSREQWEQLVDATLQDLGLAGHQALVVAHRDTDHEHVHIMVNRVHPETFRAWDRWQDRPRLMASLRKQELAFGLTPTPHVKNSDRVPDPLVQGFERTGEPPLLDYARSVARPLMQQAKSWSELHERLAEHGLFLDRKGQGLVLSDDRHAVKASSVHRDASLRALESRLGAFEPRGPRLDLVDAGVRAEYREEELAPALLPLRRAEQAVQDAEKALDWSQRHLDAAREAIDHNLERLYRRPDEAARRFLARLDAGDDLATFRPAELGPLRGTVLVAGRHALPLDSQGARATREAAEHLPRLAASYREAAHRLALAEVSLEAFRRDHQRLESLLRPQLEEWRKLQAIPRANLPQQILSLRPTDQLALARAHGPQLVRWAAEQAPHRAATRTTSRESWMRNLGPQLDRALDRRLRRSGVQARKPAQSFAAWAAHAAGQGLRPLNVAQALLRSGASLPDAVRAVSSILPGGNPTRKAIVLAAKALGSPVLPLRLASIGWSLARGVVRIVSR